VGHSLTLSNFFKAAWILPIVVLYHGYYVLGLYVALLFNADIGWGMMDRPPESPILPEGYLMSALILDGEERFYNIQKCSRRYWLKR
jgi:hypothetical protein